MTLTREMLCNIFDYDPSGNLIWKVKKAVNTVVGSIAGCIDDKGYRTIRLGGKNYKAHRLIWLYHHGEWPKNGIDHIDRDPGNNRIENLRDVSRALNNLNRSLPNSTGYAGVRQTRQGRFAAQIGANGQKAHLGTFDTPEEAHAAFKRAHAFVHGENSEYYEVAQ